MVKLYEELTISDDFMFGNAMGDKVVSRSGWICIRGIKSECTMQSCRTRESAGESVGVIWLYQNREGRRRPEPEDWWSRWL